jgi:hypothetical protein
LLRCCWKRLEADSFFGTVGATKNTAEKILPPMKRDLIGKASLTAALEQFAEKRPASGF